MLTARIGRILIPWQETWYPAVGLGQRLADAVAGR